VLLVTLECVRNALTVSAAQVRELWLSSEDTGAYGRDLGTPLPQLLAALAGALAEAPAAPDGGPRVMMRLGMTNPPFMLAALDDVAAALNHPAVFAYLHVPVQSGSDAVLARMRREYTVSNPTLTLPRFPPAPLALTAALCRGCGIQAPVHSQREPWQPEAAAHSSPLHEQPWLAVAGFCSFT
jgi:hypothetical protein